jgi:hypothetical protein
MKTHEAYDLDSSGRRRLFNFYSSCLVCGLGYKKQKVHSEGKKQELYCSAVCFNSTLKILLRCAHCNKEFLRFKSDIRKRTKNESINFCCVDCKNKAVKYMPEIRPAFYGTAKDYRSIALKAFDNKCNRCGNYDSRVLEVHHKDRDKTNNSLSNLEILCANCHTIEHKSS